MRRLRRVARIAGFTLGGLVALAALALGFLQTPWGRDVVRGRIEAKLAAAVDGQVRLGSVDYSFLFHDVSLGDLELRDAQGRPAIAIKAVRVALDRGSLLASAPVIEQLTVDGLDVHSANLKGLFKPRTGTPLASIRVEQLAITGGATITRPDGTTITVRDLRLAGTLAARPAAKELDLALHDLGATATVHTPGLAPREVPLGVASVTVARRAGGVELEIAKLVSGAFTVDRAGASLHLDGERLAGPQSITLAGVHVDDSRLTKLLGRELLAHDASADVSIAGPLEALVVDGEVLSGGAKLALDGTLDLTDLARPRYDLTLAGTGLRSDLVARGDVERPLVETSLTAKLAGAGITPGDIDARLDVTVGKTQIGALAVDGLTLAATAHRGALTLERLAADAPGVAIEATGALAEDKQVTGRVTVQGTPAEVVAALAQAGIVLPQRAPLPPKLDLAIRASGNLDGALAVELEPARVRLAGGTITLAGHAALDHQQLVRATTDVGVRGLDLAALARLAGKRPTLTGSVSGTIALAQTAAGKHATYDLALDTLGLAVRAKGAASDTALTAAVTARRGKTTVATLAASVPLTRRGGKPAVRTDGPLALDLDVARRSFAELAELVPPRLRGKLPAGAAELHVALRGTTARPTGTIDVALTAQTLKQAQQRVALHADVASSARGLAIATRGQVWLRDEAAPIATLAGTVTTAPPLARGALDVRALRASAAVDLVIDLPARELADLAWLAPPLAKLGGRLDGRIAIEGPLAAPVLDARIAARDVPTAAGTPGATTLVAHGTPAALTATLTHGEGITLTAAIDRAADGRIAVDLAATASHAPLVSALPAFLAPRLGPHHLGALDWAMTGKLALVRGARGLVVDSAQVAGTLDVTGGAIAVPGSTRTWTDIALSVTVEPAGVRLRSLALHEHDRQVADRTLTATGFLALDHVTPQRAELALVARDWLVSGTPLLGEHDAPRATATFDLGVTADLRAPVLAVDATVRRLALLIPDRLERGHEPEYASVGGDVIYLDGSAPAGKLPVAPRPASAPPRARRPIDVRVHIPDPIHVAQGPIDVFAHGELAVRVRGDGVTTRGALTVDRGALDIMGRDYRLVAGELAFTDAHPHGQLHVEFENPLPPAVMRELSRASAGGGARFVLSGAPGNPNKDFAGASNAGLADTMSTHMRGTTRLTSAPDLPASTTVVAPRGDQLGVLSFMSTNLPHLIVLDRVNAYSDQYDGPAAYGRIRHAELERYSKDQRDRVRGVVRPPTPGRSSAELQVDHLLINDDRTAVGVGVRAGDRLGGGVGLFLEWSSED